MVLDSECMTKEEFYYLAEHKPLLIEDSVFQLTVRYYLDETREYHAKDTEEEWSYPIFSFSKFFSSKNKAWVSYKEYLKNEKCIHSAIIERLALNTPVNEGNQLAWWAYNNKGVEINKSVCTSLFKEEPSIQDVYFGRKPDEIPFSIGEIVEIIRDGRVYLEILNGIPLTIDECWLKYEVMVKLKGHVKPGDFGSPYFCDSMADQYYYLQKNGFDPDVAPYLISKPIFPVPEKSKELLDIRFNHWKSLVNKKGDISI